MVGHKENDVIITYQDKTPNIERALFLAPSADIIGQVSLGERCSVWYHAVIRADVAAITIGDGTNIQDNVVIHADLGKPTVIGNHVTVGHSAIVHACTIGDFCLVGMGAIVLNQAVVGDHCLIAAGALLPPGKTYPPRSLLVGSPAKAIRLLTDEELADIASNASHYEDLARLYAARQTI